MGLAKEVAMNKTNDEAGFAKALARWALRSLHPTSVLQMGSGPGIYLQPYEKQNVHTLGIDVAAFPAPRSRNLIVADASMADLGRYIGKYDLGLCIELCEHLDTEASYRVLENLSFTCRKVIFTANEWSEQHHGRKGHINARPKGQWAKMLERYGLIGDVQVTRHLLSYMRQNCNCPEWFGQTVMVLGNKRLR
jgi:hypothetical protein